MKQYPGRIKYKKYHRVNKACMNKIETRSFYPLHGFSGTQVERSCKLTYKQIESCRRTLRRGLNKTGSIWIRAFTSVPVTKRPVASRMGKGKGNVSYWIAPVRKGQVIFETNEWDLKRIEPVFTRVFSRLPVKAKCVLPRY